VVVYLEAALDSASKLRGELTVDDRRTAVLRVHVAESIVGSPPMQLRFVLGARIQARSV
jgi:hypothetical protein